MCTSQQKPNATALTRFDIYIALVFQASSVQTHLLEIEPEYKNNLLNAVEVYKETMVVFVDDYDDK